MPIDFAVTGRMCGGVFGNRRTVPVLHRDGEAECPVPRGVLSRVAILDDAGAGTRLNSFDTVLTFPTGDVPGRPPRQGDRVTTGGDDRVVLAARPDEGGMTTLILQE